MPKFYVPIRIVLQVEADNALDAEADAMHAVDVDENDKLVVTKWDIIDIVPVPVDENG